MIIVGVILIILAVLFYIMNISLINYFINKEIPGLIDVDSSLPEADKDEEYLWERTAGTGIVPKWVSVIGLAVYPVLLVGIVLVVVAIIR